MTLIRYIQTNIFVANISRDQAITGRWPSVSDSEERKGRWPGVLRAGDHTLDLDPWWRRCHCQ